MSNEANNDGQQADKEFLDQIEQKISNLSLDNYRKNAKFCDIVLLTKRGGKFPVHRIILELFSDNNKITTSKKFQSPYGESCVLLEDINKETLELILKYIYSGRLNITDENFLTLLEGATYLELEPLKVKILEFASKRINLFSYLKIYEIAQNYNKIDKLNEIFSLDNLLLSTESLNGLSSEEIICLIDIFLQQKRDLSYLIEKISEWLDYDYNQRAPNYPIIFKKFLTLPTQIIPVKLVKKEMQRPILKKNKECFDIYVKIVEEFLDDLFRTTGTPRDMNSSYLEGFSDPLFNSTGLNESESGASPSSSPNNVNKVIAQVQKNIPNENTIKDITEESIAPANNTSNNSQNSKETVEKTIDEDEEQTNTETINENKDEEQVKEGEETYDNLSSSSSMSTDSNRDELTEGFHTTNNKPTQVERVKGSTKRSSDQSSTSDNNSNSESSSIPKKIFRRDNSYSSVANKLTLKAIFIGGIYTEKTLGIFSFDIEKYEFKKMFKLKQNRDFPSIIYAQGQIYYIGGYYGGENACKTGLCININQGSQWKSIPQLSVGRSDFQTVFLNNCIYAIGGLDGVGKDKTGGLSMNSVEVLNLKLKSNPKWNFVSPMKEKRESFGATVFNGKIYVAGGRSVQGSNICISLNKLECYNPSTNTWTELKDMIMPKTGNRLAVLGRKIYCVGGKEKDVGPARSCEVYDVEKDKWTEMKSKLNYPKNNFALISAHGKLYAFDQNYPPEIYDPELDKWEIFKDFITLKDQVQDKIPKFRCSTITVGHF